MDPKVFNLSLGEVQLSVSDIWPDGDAPENPTPQDVADLIAKCGGVRAVLSEWNLIDEIVVTSYSRDALGITGVSTAYVR